MVPLWQPATDTPSQRKTRNKILWEGVRFLGVGGNRSARRKPTKVGMESANQIHIQPLASCIGERKVCEHYKPTLERVFIYFLFTLFCLFVCFFFLMAVCQFLLQDQCCLETPYDLKGLNNKSPNFMWDQSYLQTS